MSMNLYVAKVHKIEYSTPKIHGYDECENFISRVNDYAAVLNVDGFHENGYGDGYADYEIPRSSLEHIVEQPHEWFIDNELGWTPDDRPRILSLLKDADQDNDYVYVYCC